MGCCHFSPSWRLYCFVWHLRFVWRQSLKNLNSTCPQQSQPWNPHWCASHTHTHQTHTLIAAQPGLCKVENVDWSCQDLTRACWDIDERVEENDQICLSDRSCTKRGGANCCTGRPPWSSAVIKCCVVFSHSPSPPESRSILIQHRVTANVFMFFNQAWCVRVVSRPVCVLLPLTWPKL